MKMEAELSILNLVLLTQLPTDFSKRFIDGRERILEGTNHWLHTQRF
jgi:hypothetical protein